MRNYINLRNHFKTALYGLVLIGFNPSFAGSYEDYFSAMCQKVIASKPQLVADLQALGFEVLPSAANFIFARFPGRDGADIAGKLRDRSIIVRHFRQPPRISPFVRITIGTDEQCAGLVDALRDIIKAQ